MFIKECNSALERELSAYRFNGKILVPFTSELELSEIKEASNTSKLYAQHLDQALNLLSDRKAPDYRNSIKESISAVEAMCQLITGNKKAILEDALRQLETKLPSVHPALRDAFRKIYAYSGDADGIRHALKDEPNLGIEDAKFMLVACSAFINFLLAKADRTGIKLSQQLVVQ